jgi:glycosyltransferase involved in cell wall biosynthesis
VKRVELTLQAFAHAARGWAGAATGAARPVLALVGDGDAAYVRTLRAKAAALGIVENGVAPAPTGAGPVGVVRWAGWLAGEAKAAALCAADALVINSEFENFCYALVEACSAGTPVVMSDNLAMSAAAAGAGAGVATSATAEGLGEGLRRVWRAASAAESRGAEPAMGLAAAAWARERFAPAAVGGALDALYQAVATR